SVAKFRGSCGPAAKKIDNLHVADWDTFSRDTDGWFRDDNVHLITRGAIGLAQLLNQSLAPILAARDAAAATTP
ncbi:MAG: hypothetical protein EBW27_07930, partial [Acidimicrobiia bacterium]|nr:hypothetical protein [Acidimicrobiia bacterium]